MKYIRQFGIILGVTCAGEACRYLIPLPVPAGIYGLLILLALLAFKVIRLEQVKEAGTFLIEIMPVMFIPAAAGLLDSWEVVRTELVPYTVITALTTVLVMAVSGKAVQAVTGPEKREEEEA